MTTQQKNCARLLELGWTETDPSDSDCRTFVRNGLEADAWADGTVNVDTLKGHMLGYGIYPDTDTALEKAREFCAQGIKVYTDALEDLR